MIPQTSTFSTWCAPGTFDSSMNLLSQFKYFVRVQRVSPSTLAVPQHTESIREERKMILDHLEGRKHRILESWERRPLERPPSMISNKLNGSEVMAVTFLMRNRDLERKYITWNWFVNINKVRRPYICWNPEKYLNRNGNHNARTPTDRGFQ